MTAVDYNLHSPSDLIQRIHELEGQHYVYSLALRNAVGALRLAKFDSLNMTFADMAVIRAAHDEAQKVLEHYGEAHKND